MLPASALAGVPRILPGWALPVALEVAWRSLHGIWFSLLERLPHLAAALVVVAAFWLLGSATRWGVQSAARRARMPRELAELFGTLAAAALRVLGALVGAVVVFPDFTPGNLVAGLGITSVAVGFAFRDILQNFFAGILILWRRPFHIGDEIRSGEHEGRVEEITTRSTRIHTYDGERVVIPNADVYTRAVLVRTAHPLRRVRFNVGIAYGAPIDQAREVIHRALADTQGVLRDPAPWVHVSELASWSVDFAVYFWTASPQANVLAVTDRAITAVKLALDRAGIEIPFPHTVVVLPRPDREPAEDDARGR